MYSRTEHQTSLLKISLKCIRITLSKITLIFFILSHKDRRHQNTLRKSFQTAKTTSVHHDTISNDFINHFAFEADENRLINRPIL